jgi:hypothetical protein
LAAEFFILQHKNLWSAGLVTVGTARQGGVETFPGTEGLIFPVFQILTADLFVTDTALKSIEQSRKKQ